MYTHVTIKSGTVGCMKIYDQSSKLNVDGMLFKFLFKILLLIRIFGCNVTTVRTIPSSTWQ